MIAGRIVAGPWVRLACKRHLKDLVDGPKRGLVWSLDHAQRAIAFFGEVLKLNGGTFEGKPFVLIGWQQFCVGSIFGWLNADGFRRFRTAYMEIGKGAGKSPMAAGIGLYCLTSDNESRAEIFAAATKKDQAMILFRDAVAMVDLSPHLKGRLVKTGGRNCWNLAYNRTASFFRAISSDDGQSGPRPHCSLIDELHEHPNGNVCDMLKAGQKFRRQPLTVKITNSGFDRDTVCYRDHEYSTRVVSGSDINDEWFAYVCALDVGSRTEVLACPDVAARLILKACNARTIPNVSPSGAGSVPPAIPRNADGETSRPESDALITLIERSIRAASARVATTNNDAQKILSTSAKAMNSARAGLPQTSTNVAPPMNAGAKAPGPNTSSGNASRNTGSAETTSTGFLPTRGACAEFAADRMTLSELTIATLPALSEGYSAARATLESVCWETTRLLYAALLPTCKGLASAKFDARSVAVEIEGDEPIGTAKDPFSGRACWIKTNPSLGVTIRDDYIEGQIRDALGMPGLLSLVRRLNFCEWVDAAHPWIDGPLWLACEKKFDALAELAKCDTVVGAIDLGGTRDMCALTLAGRRADGKIIAHNEYWTPADTLHDRARADKVEYDLWVEQGFVHTTPGRAVDYAFVANRLAELVVLLPLYRVCFDPYRIAYLEPEIDNTGAELELIAHPQGGYKTQPKLDKYGTPIPSLWMPRSIELLEKAVGDGRFIVEKNPCLTWNSASAVLVANDDKGNLIFSKRRSRGRIDGIVTAAMAVGLLLSADGNDALDALLEGGAIT